MTARQDRIAALSAPERVIPREEQPMALPVTTPSMTAPQSTVATSLAPFSAKARIASTLGP